MFVVKRNGQKQPVQFDKITARIVKLCYGLNADFVDPISVAQKVTGGEQRDHSVEALVCSARRPLRVSRRARASCGAWLRLAQHSTRRTRTCHAAGCLRYHIAFTHHNEVLCSAGVYKGVTTSELDELAAETAASLTATHPDYAVLAARIAISNLHKNTLKSFSATVKKLYEHTNPKTGARLNYSNCARIEFHVMCVVSGSNKQYGLRQLHRNVKCSRARTSKQCQLLRVSRAAARSNAGRLLREAVAAASLVASAGIFATEVLRAFMLSCAHSMAALIAGRLACSSHISRRLWLVLHCSRMTTGARIRIRCWQVKRASFCSCSFVLPSLSLLASISSAPWTIAYCLQTAGHARFDRPFHSK